MELQENYLLKLQEVLRVKNFSNQVKQHIRKTLSKVYELDIENKEQHLFSIIEGLKKVETFKINTRENLLKIKSIKNHLTPTTMGFVTASSDLVAVVKDEFDTEVNYHELVHLSQTERSYHIDEKYGFSKLFQHAMKEGEAIYYEMKLLEKEFPKIMCNGKVTLFSYHSMTYKIFLELYQDMRNLLNSSLLEKWKQGDTKDIMLELEEYVTSNYGVDFSLIYKTWAGLLYHFCIREDSETNSLAHQEYKTHEKNHQNNKSHHQFLSSQEDSYKTSIKNETSRLIEINELLENEANLNNGFLQKVSEATKELSEYILEYGEDEVAKEWHEEIETVTLQDYKNSLITEKSEIETNKHQNQEKLNQVSKERIQVDWIESFYFSLSKCSLEELADFKETIIMSLQEKSVELKQKSFLLNVLYYGSILNVQKAPEDIQKRAL